MSASSTSKALRIVAGVDGSPSSRAGLRWAVREAALTGGTVDAVMALHLPPTRVVSGVGAGYPNQALGVLASRSPKWTRTLPRTRRGMFWTR